ncbi:MAG: toll/interleukin-1 receptor domain-containing protein [Crocosphaera sp.]|nr:toll/interleukin-1 receptor domain-containing protein [Crocosphaera sp.]
MINQSHEIFVSYAWERQSQEIVEQLSIAFKTKGINLIKDKQNLAYKESITDFMKCISKSNIIIVVISDQYLKSENCMFELIEIDKNGDFIARIFPLVLDDANIYNAVGRLGYIHYWEAKINNLENMMKKGGLDNLQGITDDLNLYKEIRQKIAKITDTLKTINNLTTNRHQQSNFEEVIEAVETRLNED